MKMNAGEQSTVVAIASDVMSLWKMASLLMFSSILREICEIILKKQTLPYAVMSYCLFLVSLKRTFLDLKNSTRYFNFS